MRPANPGSQLLPPSPRQRLQGAGRCQVGATHLLLGCRWEQRGRWRKYHPRTCSLRNGRCTAGAGVRGAGEQQQRCSRKVCAGPGRAATPGSSWSPGRWGRGTWLQAASVAWGVTCRWQRQAVRADTLHRARHTGPGSKFRQRLTWCTVGARATDAVLVARAGLAAPAAATGQGQAAVGWLQACPLACCLAPRPCLDSPATHQFWESVLTSTQMPLQLVSARGGAWEWQAGCRAPTPPSHTCSFPPPSHHDSRPVGQDTGVRGTPQDPAVHDWPTAHTTPQNPQLLASD